METNVPRLGANTPIANDNTTYNKALALDLMKEYIRGSLPRTFIPWLVKNHSGVRGLVGYDDAVFDKINRQAFKDLKELDINEFTKDVVFAGKNQKDIVSDAEILDSIRQQIKILEARKKEVLSEEDKEYIQSYINRLAAFSEKREERKKITLQEVLNDRASRFYTTIDIDDDDMGYLIGEYGFIRNLITGEKAGIASDLIDEISVFINQGKEDKDKVDVKNYVNEAIAEKTLVQGQIDYLKRMLPTGGNILEWISGSQEPEKVLRWGFSIPSMGVDSDGNPIVTSPPMVRRNNIAGFRFENILNFVDDIELTEEEIKILQQEGIKLKLNKDGEPVKTFKKDDEDYLQVLGLLPQDKAVAIVVKALKKSITKTLPPELVGFLQTQLDKIRVTAKRRERGEVIQSDIKVETLLAFKRGMESTKFRKRDAKGDDNINITSNRKGITVKGTTPRFDFNLIPEWNVGDAYVTDKPQRKKVINLKQSFTINKAADPKIKELAKRNSLITQAASIKSNLNTRTRKTSEKQRQNIESSIFGRIEEYKEAFDDFLKMIEKEKWTEQVKENINLEVLQEINNKDNDIFVDELIKIRFNGESPNKYQKYLDELKKVVDYFEEWNDEIDEKFKAQETPDIEEFTEEEEEDENKVSGIQTTDFSGMTIEDKNEAKTNEEDEIILDALDELRQVLRTQIRNRILPIDSDELKDLINRFIDDMNDVGSIYDIEVNQKDYEEDINALEDSSKMIKLRESLLGKFKEIQNEGALNETLDKNDIKGILLRNGLYENLSRMANGTDVADPRNQGEISFTYQLTFTPIGMDLDLEIKYIVTGINRLTVSSATSPRAVVRRGMQQLGTTNIPFYGGKRISSGKATNSKRREFYNNIRKKLINLDESV